MEIMVSSLLWICLNFFYKVCATNDTHVVWMFYESGGHFGRDHICGHNGAHASYLHMCVS